MRELPILFNAPMVRAILEGRKTVTRRVVKPQPAANQNWAGWVMSSTCQADEGKASWAEGAGPLMRNALQVRPPYQVGDRLYVRETYFGNHFEHPNEPVDERDLHYRADGYEDFEGERIIWRPAIHMPKWAARIWLEVTAVRVERLQDITYEQAIAEGAMDAAPTVDHFQPGGEETSEETARRLRWPQRDFGLLWDQLAKPGARWDDNPWVWVVEFRRVEAPRADQA